jgi:hypothetical protein
MVSIFFHIPNTYIFAACCICPAKRKTAKDVVFLPLEAGSFFAILSSSYLILIDCQLMKSQ